MRKTIKNTAHQSVWLRERPAQIVRVREAELMREIITRITVDHILFVMFWWRSLMVLLKREDS
jgi:hypothetical protein